MVVFNLVLKINKILRCLHHDKPISTYIDHFAGFPPLALIASLTSGLPLIPIPVTTSSGVFPPVTEKFPSPMWRSIERASEGISNECCNISKLFIAHKIYRYFYSMYNVYGENILVVYTFTILLSTSMTETGRSSCSLYSLHSNSDRSIDSNL